MKAYPFFSKVELQNLINEFGSKGLDYQIEYSDDFEYEGVFYVAL